MADITLPVNRTLVPSQGLDVVFDPAALTNWPDALEPDGLPAPTTTPRSIRLKLTARRPFTIADSTAMQLVDEPIGNSEWSGVWGNAAGALDPEPGIDYWRATNFDVSTGVYGWRALYGTGASSSYLDLGSDASHAYTTGQPFDIVFRVERPDWLHLGDGSYLKYVALLGGSSRWSIWFDARPSSAATNNLNFNVAGMGNVAATQAALGAVNDVPIWIKCSRVGTTLSISRSDDGASWTTVSTASFGGTPNMGTTPLVVGGNGGGSFWNARSNIDGTLSEFTYSVDGALVADIGMNDVPNVLALSWTATPPGRTVNLNGGTLLGGAVGTIEPVFTFASPSALSDFVLTMPAVRSGEVLVEQVILEAECGGGIYRDGRVHLS